MKQDARYKGRQEIEVSNYSLKMLRQACAVPVILIHFYNTSLDFFSKKNINPYRTSS